MRRLVVIAMLAICACARHDALPPALEVVEPPAPINFTVETIDNITYQLSWQVDDPTAIVTYFRVYSKFDYSSPAFEDTTSLRSAQVSTIIPLPGIIFCVSSVSDAHVESRLTCGSAE